MTRASRSLSRLELAILGLVSTKAPCTAYWVRKQFQDSPSSHFSGSGGAVYPALRRLESLRLVRASAQREGARRSRGYRLTARGEEALRSWLTPPIPMPDITYAFDPVRTRVYYLEVLRPSERLRLVDDALAKTREFAAEVEADCKARRKAGDVMGYLGARGVRHEVRGRMRWLGEMRRALGGRKRNA